MTQTLVILQNAWFKDLSRSQQAILKYGYAFFVRCLARSRSGLRLAEIFPQPWQEQEVYFGEASPQLGDHSGACFEPDLLHVKTLLQVHSPHLVVACGQKATAVVSGLWPGRLLCMPHPAYRMLASEMLIDIRNKVQMMLQSDRIEQIRYVSLPPVADKPQWLIDVLAKPRKARKEERCGAKPSA